MHADSITLRGILAGSSRYVVPPFQRDYAWGRDDWKRLWGDIIDRYNMPDEEEGKIHFMGALTFRSFGYRLGTAPTLQIINGQQRIITLSALLCALRNTARNFSLGRLGDEIEQRYLIDQFEEGRDRFRVAPRQRDRPEYRAAVTGERAPRGRIGGAMRYFARRIAEDVVAGASNAQGTDTALEDAREETGDSSGQVEEIKEEDPTAKRSEECEAQTQGRADGGHPDSEDSVEARLRKLLDVLGERLRFVHITLSDEADPFEVYELINNSGVDLTQADLIRSQAMRHVPAERQEEFEAESWRPLEDRFVASRFGRQGGSEIDSSTLSDFYRHGLLTEGSYIFKSDTEGVFKKRYIEEDENFTPERLAARLRREARLYSYLQEGISHPITPVAEAIEQLVALDAKTVYPPVFKLLDMLDQGETTGSVVAEAVRRLAGFILRRRVCGDPSRGYVRWFVFACKHIDGCSGGPLAGLTRFLKKKGYPSDRRFTNAFCTYDLYHADGTRAVLDRLEESHLHREPADLSNVEVEHIMPQNLSGQWRKDLGFDAEHIHQNLLHVAGNLTLSAYNTQLKDDPFSVKRMEYARSNVQITRHLADFEEWTAEKIKARSLNFAKRAAKLWTGPPFEDA